MLAGNLGGASLDNVVRICNGLDTSIGTMQSAYMMADWRTTSRT